MSLQKLLYNILTRLHLSNHVSTPTTSIYSNTTSFIHTTTLNYFKLQQDKLIHIKCYTIHLTPNHFLKFITYRTMVSHSICSLKLDNYLSSSHILTLHSMLKSRSHNKFLRMLQGTMKTDVSGHKCCMIAY